jgi:hypothetical protein
MRAETVVWSISTAPGRRRGKGALRAEHHIGQVIVVAHAGDHRVGALGGFGRAGGHARGQAGVGGHPGLAPGIAAVEDGQAVAGLAQMAGDGPAHGAKADAGDGEWFGHAGCLTALCGRASPPGGAAGLRKRFLCAALCIRGSLTMENLVHKLAHSRRKPCCPLPTFTRRPGELWAGGAHPTLHSQTLSRITGAEIYIKFENLQFTAAYKERGALNALLLLTEEQRSRGVIAASAGNHAQGLSYHGTRLGVPVTIVMPRTTPAVKIMQTESVGGNVVLEGETFDEAYAHARKLEGELGLTFVHPFDDPAVAAGQGTVALEMLTDVPSIDMLVVPIGGGGLLTGMGTVARALKPDIGLVGVQAQLFPRCTTSSSMPTCPAAGIRWPRASRSRSRASSPRPFWPSCSTMSCWSMKAARIWRCCSRSRRPWSRARARRALP